MKLHAKVNLSLNVVGREQSGYHILDMVVASAHSLYDVVGVRKRDDGRICVSMRGAEVEQAQNTAYRAAQQFLCGTNFGADIEIIKGIPMRAGLGGSSADAAATLLELNRIMPQILAQGQHSGSEHLVRQNNTSPQLSASRLQAMALKVGSDVPYMMIGGFARVGGLGERVQPIDKIAPLYGVIAKGDEGVSTPLCYQKFDELYPSGEYSPTQNDALIAALKAGNLAQIAASMNNALTAPAILLCPQIEQIQLHLKREGALATVMSGSGSAVFGLFEDERSAVNAAKRLAKVIFFAKQVRLF